MTIYHSSDALNKAFAMFFISALLDFLGIEYGSIEAYPTEIIKDNERRFMDYAVMIDGSYIINLEFHEGQSLNASLDMLIIFSCNSIFCN